ncbi:MAG TPA: hypothetical protein VHG51_08180 [Longimicrobiaceae bacterium]|nr:hypothetical protein [Longimicrobiaceae bacterium]
MWAVLVPVALALAALAAFLRSDAGRERRRGALVATGVAAAVAVLGVVPLMGIPGAVVYELSAPWVRLLMGAGYEDLGDGAWPAALLITIAWPSSLVLAYVAANGPLRHRGRLLRAAAWVLIPYATGVALALVAHWSA